MTTSRTKTVKTITILGIVLLVLCLLSLRCGSANVSWNDFFKALVDINKKTPFGVIVYGVRLPRVLSGIAAGMGLSVSGLLLQSVTDNKMASPNLIGVSSGAGFAVILSMSCFPKLFGFVPAFAFAGAFLSTLFIAALSRKIGMTKGTVILVGLAFSSVLTAGISLFSMLDSDVLVSYNAFSIGSLSGVELDGIILPSAMIAVSFMAAMVLSGKIDMLTLGDEAAFSLGIKVSTVRILVMLIASASAAAAVSFAGLLGFVGLMSAHIARRFVPENTSCLLPVSALVGSILVVGADLIGRIAFAPSEIPVGILMALLGAPFFLILLLTGGNRNA